MSFRELRDATEMLRALGYPRLVSVDNFRFPNFPLMAEMLEWTVCKFDSNARVPRQIEGEADRVLFIKNVVLILLQKAHVRLNPKHLYQSDGHAIRELLPVLRMLYEGVKDRQRSEQQRSGGSSGAAGDESVLQISAMRSQINAKRQELRQTVQLATELPKSGANLYELLRDEVFAKEVRTKALGRSLNATQVEAEIRERIQSTEQRILETRSRLENIDSDEQELGRKIERRKREMNQLQKRLAKLQAFRPPYMDEYERYEAELRDRYAVYVTLFRNLHSLQHQLSLTESAERERALEAERSMRVAVERVRAEQTAPMIAALPIGALGLEEGEEEDDEDKTSRGQSREVRVFGNMIGMGLSDDEDGEEEELQQDYGAEDDEEEEEEDDGRIIEMEGDEDREEKEEVETKVTDGQEMEARVRSAERGTMGGEETEVEDEEEENHSGDNF